MVKAYLVSAYAILVKAGKWALEASEGETRPVVPVEYQPYVAEYLALHP